jgi:glucose/mannose-6-phosphate isomerase
MPPDDGAVARPAVNLDDPGALERADPHGAREALAGFPEQCRRALALRPSGSSLGPRPRLVVVAGMGGSAASGDLLAACAADRLDVPVLVHRGYELPAVAGPGTLVIVSSYSGETAEALSAAETALARGCRLAVITSGGRLRALAERSGLVRVDVPPGLMPRMALGWLFFPLLALLRLADILVLKDEEVQEALHLVAALGAELEPARAAAHNEAKRLASDIGARLPVVYGGPVTGTVAYRWKTDLEENAKAFAVAGTLPEMNHNEIEAWSGPLARTLHLVLLRDRAESPEIARRFALLRELIGGSAGGVSEAWARGSGVLARLLSLVYLGQWTSFYLAVRRGVDPWSVPVLDALKGRLGAPR